MNIHFFVVSADIVIIVENKDFPCICGHPKSIHFNTYPIFGCGKRRGYGIQGTGWVDDCREFVPDNLKYMEDKYDQRSSNETKRK